MALARIRREGTYYRVCKPEWVDCEDTSYSKQFGGRWTPTGEFGALYLCATIEVAAAVVRAQHSSRAIPLFSLRPNRRPQLQRFSVQTQMFVDIITEQGVSGAGFPSNYPYEITRQQCWPIARQAYRDLEHGVAYRSAAECDVDSWLGEELAIFDRSRMPRRIGDRINFSKWYPDLIPDLK